MDSPDPTPRLGSGRDLGAARLDHNVGVHSSLGIRGRCLQIAFGIGFNGSHCHEVSNGYLFAAGHTTLGESIRLGVGIYGLCGRESRYGSDSGAGI